MKNNCLKLVIECVWDADQWHFVKYPKVLVLNPEDRPGFGFSICPFFGDHYDHKEAGEPFLSGCFGLSFAASRFSTIPILILKNVFVRILKVWYKFSKSFPCLYAPVEVACFPFAAKSYIWLVFGVARALWSFTLRFNNSRQLIAWIILPEKVFVCLSDAGYLDEKNRCWIRRKQWRRCNQL